MAALTFMRLPEPFARDMALLSQEICQHTAGFMLSQSAVSMSCIFSGPASVS